MLQPLKKTPKRKKDKQKHSITDSATWLEAWNRYLCAHLVHFPSQALELAKYQTMVIMFFAHHPPYQCIEYDRLFRQAVARIGPFAGMLLRRTSTSGPSHAAVPPFVTTLPFATSPPSLPALDPHLRTAQSNSLTPLLGEKSAEHLTLADAQSLPKNAYLHTPAGIPAARVPTLAKDAPIKPELTRAPTTIRYSQFESELRNYPDKANKSWLLNGIQFGVSLGYNGPRGPLKARNLISTHTHPHIVNKELGKEMKAGSTLGPFLHTPPSLSA